MKIKKSLINVVLLLFILLFTMTGMIYQGGTPQYKSETPKTSDGEITIVTPENKTYTEPMQGYYPANYGFENELDGTPRTSIAYVDGTNELQANCDVVIVNSFQGHNKVLRIHDGNTNGNAEATHHFDSTQTTGTIEWWWLTPDVSDNRMWIHFHQDQVGILGFSLGAINNEFFQNNGTIVQTYNFNQWYHHEVSFDTISDTYDWYIDGIMVLNDGAFENPVTNVGSTNIKGAWSTIGDSYFDAFGFSWTSDYSIGDNLYEGLLISFRTDSLNISEMEYSLDWGPNISITLYYSYFGNKVIPMPDGGTHNIQFFGNSTTGMMFESEVIYFTVDFIPYINIITPENIIYTSPMAGYYPGSYGFENELDGTSRTNIGYVDSTNGFQSNCEVKIVNSFQGHNKVLRIHDGNTNGNAEATDYFDSTQTTGYIEWWWSTSVSGSNVISYHFHEGIMGTHVGGIDMQDGIFWDMEQNAIQSYVANQWYHHRVTFDTINDTYDWYIDGILRVDEGDFETPVSNIGSTNIKGGWMSTGSCYIDAIAYNWDKGYLNYGANMKEGLLLSYESNTNLDWIGYSLNWNSNITITGNKVIPFLWNGSHSIIITGIISEGMVIRSEERMFSISIQDPPPPPPTLPDNPYLIPIFLTSIALGIIALLGITLLLLRKKISPRTGSIITPPLERPSTQNIENIDYSNQINFCPICGATADNTYKFCANCGASFRNI